MKSNFYRLLLISIILIITVCFTVDYIRIKSNNYPIFCPIIVPHFGYYNSFEAYGLGYKVNCYVKTEHSRDSDENISTNVTKRFDIGPYFMKYDINKYFEDSNSYPITITGGIYYEEKNYYYSCYSYILLAYSFYNRLLFI